MNFLFVGAGGLGSVLAAQLAHHGHAVRMLARGRRADLLERDGLRLTGLSEISVKVPIVRPGQRTDADVVVLCTKAYDTREALAGLNLIGTPIAFSLQNGVLKNDELVDRFGPGQVLGAAASVSGELLEDGRARFTMNHSLPIGELAGGSSVRVEQIVAAFKNSGIAALASTQIGSVEWTKYASFLPMMAAGLLTRQFTWRSMIDPDGSMLMAELVREVAALARASGVDVQPSGSLPVAAIVDAAPAQGAELIRRAGEALRERAPMHRVSALQDLLRGGRLEVDAILGHACRLGARLTVPVPAIERCHRLCAVLEHVAMEQAR